VELMEVEEGGDGEKVRGWESERENERGESWPVFGGRGKRENEWRRR